MILGIIRRSLSIIISWSMKKLMASHRSRGIARRKTKTFSLELVKNRLNEFSYLFTMILPRLNKQWQDFYETYNYQTFFR